MRVYPAPRIKGAMRRFIMTVPIVAVFMVIIVVGVSMILEMIALHVDSAVEIGVRLVYTRLAYRLARIAERDGKSAFAFHDLWHRVAKARAQTRQDNDMPKPQKQA